MLVGGIGMRVSIVVAAALLVVGAPLGAWSQGLPAFSTELGVTSPVISALPSIPGLGSFNIGAAKVFPSARVGYQSIAMSINLPIPRQNFAQTRLDLTGLDLKLNNANVWVGFLGLDTWFTPNLNLFLQLGGNAKRGITASTAYIKVTTPGPNRFPSEWTGSNLQWWMIDGRVGYRFVRSGLFCLGWKWDQLMADLTNPRDNNGALLPTEPVLYSYTGDIKIKGSMPYFGLVFGETNYYASLLFSPLATCDVQIPFDLASSVNANPANNLHRIEEARYTLNKRGGYFLEGNMEYNLNAMAGLNFGLWIKGSWMRVKGDGQDQLNAYRLNINNGNIAQRLSELGTADSTFSSYLLSGGISANLAF
jgi:hypothetical protein